MPRKTPQRRSARRKTRSPRRQHSKHGGSAVPVVVGGLVLGAAGAGGYYLYKKSQKAKQLITDVANVQHDAQPYNKEISKLPPVLYAPDYVGVGGPAATFGPRNKKQCADYKMVSDCNSNPPCQWQSFNDDKNDPNGWCQANSFNDKIKGGSRRRRSSRSTRRRRSRN